MSYNISNHLLFKDGQQVEFISTPNKNGTINPKYVIEHFTASTHINGTKSWFQSKDAKASSQLLIGRDGEIVQFCKLNERAWHAGLSSWDGINGLNAFSIGIEYVNAGRVSKKGDKFFTSEGEELKADDVIYLTHKNETKASYWQKYTTKQLAVGMEITALLVKFYNMKDVLGHDDISPNRKNDPGPAFPMESFKPNTQGIHYYSTIANLNLRVGAGTEFKAITVIPQGTKIELLLKVGDWSRINYEGTIGFVSTKYLKYT